MSGDVNQAHLKKLDTLPEGWNETSVSEIVQMISTNKKKLAQKNYLQDGEYPVIDQGQEFVAGYSNDENLVLGEETPPFIVFGDHTRAFKYANFRFVPGADGVKVMKPFGVDPKWCFYMLQAVKLPNKGYARHFQYLKEAYIPVPPPEQQKRIVSKIEELFSHIDAGIEALKKSKQLLKQYRQSVLKSAVTGQLTKEWREANKDKLELASKLLDRILKERRQKWEEQQLGKFKAKGKMPKDDKWKEKYKVPVLPTAQNTEVLPETWIYCGIEMLLPPDKAAMKTGPFGSLLKKHEHKNDGVSVLGIENIASMQFVPGSKIHITEKKAKELDGYKVLEGDILISRSGTVGEVCVVPDIGEARISTNLMKLSLMKSGLNPVFFTYLFNGSPFMLGQVAELCKGSTRDFLNQDILKKLLLVLPPYKEQLEILSQVEDRFYKLERLDNEINMQLIKSDKNKQSVLASAFSGELLQQ